MDGSDPVEDPRWVAVVDRLLDALLSLAVASTCLAIFAQVVLRYVFNNPISWADEFAVLAFAWVVFLGAAAAQRRDSHVSIDALVKLLPGSVQRVLVLVRIAAMAVVLGVLAWHGLDLAGQMSTLEYPAMGVSRSWLYAALPACLPVFALYLARTLRQRLRGHGAAPAAPVALEDAWSGR